MKPNHTKCWPIAVSAGTVPLGSLLKHCSFRLENYVTFFFNAKPAFSHCLVEITGSIDDAPIDLIVFIFIF